MKRFLLSILILSISYNLTKAQCSGYTMTVNATYLLTTIDVLGITGGTLIGTITAFPCGAKICVSSGAAFNPASVANYIYEVTKLYNRFYHECTILKEEDQNIKIFRLQLSKLCAQTISNAMNLLGIVVPEKM